MKKILAASILLFFAGTVTAQDNPEERVPANVIEALSALYPRVKEVNWNCNEPDFEASFRLDGKDVSLLFDENGYVHEVKNEIMEYELPIDVNHLLAKEYSGWKVGKASHIDVNGTAYYEAVVEKEKQTVVLVFTRTGGLLVKLIL